MLLRPAPPATRRRARSRWQPDDVDAWIVLGFAAAFAALLILVESRDNTFFNDEISIFQQLGQGIDSQSILKPHNGHLILSAHLVYAGIFTWVGPSYTALRVIGVLVLLTCGVLLFVLAKRRVGATIALVPAIVVLFLGSAWEALLWPLTMLTFGLSVAFGLGALIVLERRDLRGDVAACVLTALAVVSHSTGLAFLVGVAVMLLLRRDGLRSAWVFGVPLAIFVAWWVWALRFHEGLAHPGNLLIVPEFIATSLAAVVAAMSGLGLDLGSTSLTVTLSWGYVIATIAAVAFIVRLRRGAVPHLVWAALAVLLVYWLGLALSFGPGGRTPTESRYLFPGAVLVLLIAAAALDRIRVSRPAVIAILVVGIVSVLTNIKQLDNAERFFRDYAPRARADLGAIEIARSVVSPGFRPDQQPRLADSVPSHFPVWAGPYLQAVDRFGSYAFSAAELQHQPDVVRKEADRVLASAERLSLRPADVASPMGRCDEISGEGGTARDLAAGDVRLEGNGPAVVRLGRFASGHPVDVGSLARKRPMVLSIPRDASARPWRITIRGARTSICLTPSS